MQDLVDIHRTNIARAGTDLAKTIAEATSTYTAAIAASEAALEVAMAQRIAAFNGAGAQGEAPSRNNPLGRASAWEDELDGGEGGEGGESDEGGEGGLPRT